MKTISEIQKLLDNSYDGGEIRQFVMFLMHELSIREELKIDYFVKMAMATEENWNNAWTEFKKWDRAQL